VRCGTDFFWVYVNDLVEHFNLECDPVSINGKSTSCLLYADDIVLMSQSTNGLQKILDNLKLFCDFDLQSFKNVKLEIIMPYMSSDTSVL
jgi:hypothetical protein